MAKLVLLSVVIMMIVGPTIAASDPSGRRGLRTLVVMMLMFNLFYVFALRYIYPKLL